MLLGFSLVLGLELVLCCLGHISLGFYGVWIDALEHGFILRRFGFYVFACFICGFFICKIVERSWYDLIEHIVCIVDLWVLGK